MSNKSIPFLIITFLVLSFHNLHISAATPLPPESERLLQRLDSIISNHESLVKEKEIRIAGLRKTLANAKTDTERIGLTRQLYDEYLVFDSDSALHYATTTRKLAAKVAPEDYNLLTNWKLNEAFIYTVQGLFDTTKELLESIDSSKLSPEMKSMYFGSLSYLYSMRGVYINSNKKMWKQDMARANQYRDSIQALNLPPSPDWLWVPVATALDNEVENIGSLDVTDLKKAVDSSATASRQNAINAYWLARFYGSLGDKDSMVKYKTMAAIYDALIVNREIAALQELATYLFEQGQLTRAYSYLLYSVNQANLYHNRYRMVSLSDVLPTVRDAYRMELEKRDKRMSLLVIVLTIVSLVLLVSIIFIIVEFNKLKKMRNLLTDTNNELSKSILERDASLQERNVAIKSLEQANGELNEANKQKLSLLAYAFKLTAQYINSFEDYRKKLLKKYKVKRIDDLGVLINDPELIKEQYQGFYESFDKTVLSIFPDFIEEYNMTAGPENRISPETIGKTKTLNTKLRIYALRRLGISKSADIARMLNVSIRTVYNNKSGTSYSEEEFSE